MARSLAGLAGAGAHGPWTGGCGKTHLARVFAARSGAPVIAAADLATDLVPAQLGAARAAVVDDADRAGAEALLTSTTSIADGRGISC